MHPPPPPVNALDPSMVVKDAFWRQISLLKIDEINSTLSSYFKQHKAKLSFSYQCYACLEYIVLFVMLILKLQAYASWKSTWLPMTICPKALSKITVDLLSLTICLL